MVDATAPAGRRNGRAAAPPAVSLVVPTRNEAGNVGPLLERLEHVLHDVPLEIIFVDDSDDDTPAAVERAASASRHDVHVIHRERDDRGDGLSGAVVRGMRAARAPWVCVMDADLQHPPEVLGRLVETAALNEVDLVIASRFVDGGSTGAFGAGRSALSNGSKAAALALFPKRLRGVSDPMSGFFLVRKAVLDLDRLRPRGFKILLEILLRTPKLRRAEVGFEFGERHAGESKASLREGMRFLTQLAVARSGDRAPRLAQFVLVGASGLFVNTAVFAALVAFLGMHYLLAAIVSTQASSLWNFALSERWVFRSRTSSRTRGTRFALFMGMNNATLLVRAPMLVLLVGALSIGDVLANFISLVALTLMRFALADGLIWQDGASRLFSYDVHGLVTLESPVRLRELERFRVAALDERPSIRIRIGKLSRRQSDLVSSLAFLTRHTRYDEGLGRLGFGIEIASGRWTEVLASPLLAYSPHVLYTNVVEPIIRWSLVKKGYALVHGACVSVDGRATLITARTDTGKTTTILKLLDNHPYSFLSDDLTLVDASGKVLTYPKPLTISSHTVAAIKTPLLTLRERIALRFQSRVHSRSGRQFAFVLSKSKLPIATINALVQWLVPPPKYHVERLVPGVATVSEAQLARFVVIERGGTGDVRLGAEDALDTLMENSEDAFGFPPYPSIKEFLHNRNGHDLRAREREIVAAALADVPALVLRSETMDWYERLPGVAPALKAAAGAESGSLQGALAFEP